MKQTKNIENKLSKLFEQWCGIMPEHIYQLPHSGSSRIYYRLKNKETSALGVYNTNLNENIAFLNFIPSISTIRPVIIWQ